MKSREIAASPILSERQWNLADGIRKSCPLPEAPLSASSLFLANLVFFVTFYRCDKKSFPWFGNGLDRWPHRSIVSELDVLPVDNFVDGSFAAPAGRLTVNDL